MQVIEPTKTLRKPKNGWAIAKIKIKHGGGFKLEITSDLPPEDNERKTLKCVYTETPTAEFEDALDIVLQSVITRLELGDLWLDSEITEINLKETDEGVNAIIVACLELSDETKAIARLEDKNISFELKSKIDNFIAEVEDYAGGKRGTGTQLSLFEQQ